MRPDHDTIKKHLPDGYHITEVSPYSTRSVTGLPKLENNSTLIFFVPYLDNRKENVNLVECIWIRALATIIKLLSILNVVYNR